MTLVTYRSPFARALHAALDLAGRVCGVLQLQGGNVPRARALTVCDDAALRDLGVVPPDAWSFGALTAAHR